MKELYRFRQFLAEGKLFEEDDSTYALHITTVEYDNGKPGYTYEVVDLDTEEEVGSKFGFKPLYFVGSGDEGDQQVFKGQDFNSIKTYGMYQDKVVNKEESLEIYKGLINGEDFYEKFSFDPRDLAEGKLLKEEIKFIDYLTVDQDEFKDSYDRFYDDYGNDEDFLNEFSIDFLSPNIEKINKYYGRKLSEYGIGELITDFYEADGLEFISSNEKFEFWLNRNREFYF